MCARLRTGGLTPERETIAATCALPLPTHVMIRPSADAWTCSRKQLLTMRDQIRTARRLGAAGVVFGTLTSENRVDAEAVRALTDAAADLDTTFHRAFDDVRDHDEALGILMDLGVGRVLTSGNGRTAWHGRARLRRLVALAGGRIGIIAAGSIRADGLARLVAATGVREIHAHVRGAELTDLGKALAS